LLLKQAHSVCPVPSSCYALKSSVPVRTNIVSLALGSQIQLFNPYDYDKDLWYEAEDTDGAQAVIGYKKGGKPLTEKSRKRQRT
jgi:hypothetical protein